MLTAVGIPALFSTSLWVFLNTYFTLYNDKGRTVKIKRESEAWASPHLNACTQLDGLYEVLPAQLAHPFGDLLQRLLSCLFLNGSQVWSVSSGTATRGEPDGFASSFKEEGWKPLPAPDTGRRERPDRLPPPPVGGPGPHLPLGLPQQAPEALVTQQPGRGLGVAAELGVLQALAQLAQVAQLLGQLPLPRPRRLEVQLQVQGRARRQRRQGGPAGLRDRGRERAHPARALPAASSPSDRPHWRETPAA